MALDPPSWAEELAGPPVLDEDYLILSTVHSAKGLEWDAVYVIHAADGNFPSDMSTGSVEEIEEERRLFYVACTRAKDWLYVCFPLRYYKSPWNHTDAHGYAQLTRFLADGPRSAFRDEAGGGGAPVVDEPADPAVSGAALRGRLRAMWS
jgi:DNA helicase-2/ATP-dependent DNA helicase PcrA